MIKKTFWFFLFISCTLCTFVHLTPGFARVGSSVSDFKKSKFAKKEGFSFHDTYQLTNDPFYKGKYAYNFFTEDKRYRIQLIADQNGKNIVYEYLFYPVTMDEMLALKDGSITLDFVAESTAQNVPPEQYISLVSEANRGIRNHKYFKKVNGYVLVVTRYDNKMINGWSIGINK
jgi:hypothetical protein